MLLRDNLALNFPAKLILVNSMGSLAKLETHNGMRGIRVTLRSPVVDTWPARQIVLLSSTTGKVALGTKVLILRN